MNDNSGPARLVIAPDKFKGSLSSAEVAARVAAGIAAGGLIADVQLVPMADGGEGTVDAALSAGWRSVTRRVSGPLGDPVIARFAIEDATATAVIEMAAASGLGVLPTDPSGAPRLEALRASSRGTGELIVAALDQGCSRIVLGIGGSANTDAGAGMLAALGVSYLDARGARVPDGGGALDQLASIDLSRLDPRLKHTELVLAADVTNPLLGPSGAAAVFGPQKGAGPVQVAVLERNLSGFVEMLGRRVGESARRLAGEPGAGAAGGVGYAALLLGAARRPGTEIVAELVGLDPALDSAVVVITGEGSLDAQSLGGKTPIGVAARAQWHQVPIVLGVCGRSTLTEVEHRAAGFERVWALTELEASVERCMAEAGSLLEQVGVAIARYLDGRLGREPRPYGGPSGAGRADAERRSTAGEPASALRTVRPSEGMS